MIEFTSEFIGRFWSKIAILTDDDACWLWTAGVSEKGYGKIEWRDHSYRAHRIAYELTYGETGRLYVLHKCDNPSCCNPKHLFIGDQLANMRDMIDKGRAAIGEANGSCKLTSIQVAEIRLLYAEGGVRQIDLAVKFGVSRSQIGFIVNRRQRISR